jgi:hypothetical protein
MNGELLKQWDKALADCNQAIKLELSTVPIVLMRDSCRWLWKSHKVDTGEIPQKTTL